MNERAALALLEQQFQAHVLLGESGIERHIVGTPEADVAQRLGVYADAYRLRLVEALGEDFPGVRGLLGPAEFERLGRAYVDAHPPGTPSIRWFGRNFAAFLRDRRRDRPVLAEMAGFEWSQGEVFDAQDTTPVALEFIGTIPSQAWPGMRLVLCPAVRRLDLRWNVPELWQAIDDGRQKPSPRAQAPIGWVVWRRALSVRWRSLSPDEACGLDAVAAGATFGDICERLCGWIAPDGAALHAASLLKRWVSDELIAAVEGI